MIIPLSPYLARDFGADDLQVGLLMSTYSLAQLICAPFWGYLSDRLGRRPIIITCVIGTLLSYLLFAFAKSLTLLFLSRVLSGVFGSVMALSMACIADVTANTERSKNMGLVGAAIGLGFIIGPFLGGMCGILGNKLGSVPPLGSSFAAIGACVLCTGNLFTAIFYLKESFVPSPTTSQTTFHSFLSKISALSLKKIWSNVTQLHQSRVQHMITALRLPILRQILFMYFLITTALAGIEMSLFLYIKDEFSWSHFLASLGFTYIGVMMAVTQGFFVRKWMRLFGEYKIAMVGLFIASIGFAGIGTTSTTGTLFLAIYVTLLCIGYGLSNTSLSGAVSLLTNKNQQGSIFGVHQSLFSLARIIGPIIGGWLYRDFSHASPFYLSGLLALACFIIGWNTKEHFPEDGKEN